MKSLTPGHFKREQAETASCRKRSIDPLGDCGTLPAFLVTWRWQFAPGFLSYPVPVGRFGHTPGQTPDIFHFTSECYTERQSFSHTWHHPDRGWNRRPIRCVPSRQVLFREGTHSWNRLVSAANPSSSSVRCLAFPPAATRWASRRFWAVRPVRAQRSQPAG